MEDWAEIRETYRDFCTNQRYKPIAENMIKLVLVLESSFLITDLRPFVSPLTLNFVIPDASRVISIDWIEENKYRIYLDHCGDSMDTFWGEDEIFAIEDTVKMINRYIHLDA